MKLVKNIYVFTRSFPDDERYGLTSQLRRAAVSLVSNIAEGNGRRSRGEYLQFLGTARGSLAEIYTQLLVAQDLGFGPSENCRDLQSDIEAIRKMRNGLIASLQPRTPVR